MHDLVGCRICWGTGVVEAMMDVGVSFLLGFESDGMTGSLGWGVDE
jgi:hypothetical protein